MINNQKILYKFIQINNNVKCDTMSYQYILSENFIREFKNKINCDNILIMRKIL